VVREYIQFTEENLCCKILATRMRHSRAHPRWKIRQRRNCWKSYVHDDQLNDEEPEESGDDPPLGLLDAEEIEEVIDTLTEHLAGRSVTK
jgi:hypothetical protein